MLFYFLSAAFIKLIAFVFHLVFVTSSHYLAIHSDNVLTTSDDVFSNNPVDSIGNVIVATPLFNNTNGKVKQTTEEEEQG